MSDEKRRFSVTMDKELVAWIDSESSNRSGFIERIVKRARDGKSEIDDALTDAEIARVEKRISAKTAELEAERAYLDNLQEKQDEHLATSEKYDAHLESLLDTLEGDDGHVWPTSQPVQRISGDFDTPPREVMDHLKQRAAMQCRDLTTHNFMRADEAAMLDEEPRPIDEVADDGG